MDAHQGPPRRIRGPTRKQAIWDYSERITVTFERGQLVGDEAKELTSFLGTVAKMSQHIDIGIKDWRKIKEDKKDDLWSIVKEKFEFAPVETEEIKSWVISDIGKKWKQWKHELKARHFDTSLTVDEIIAAQTDTRVDKADFKKLVTHWFSKDAQAMSEKRKIVRSKSVEPHALGTKSFARLAEEEKKKTSVYPTRGTLYIISRTQKTGSIVNETCAKVIKQLQDDASTSTTTTSTTTGNEIVDWSNDDLARVKGKEKGGGYTRWSGPNIRLPSKRSRLAQVPLLKARIHELEGEMKDLKERQHIEMKEVKENQAAILQFMAMYKNHNSNEEFSNVLNTTNTKVANESSSVHNSGPYGNNSTSASENKISDKAVTSPMASKKIVDLSSTPVASKNIVDLSSAEMQLRKKFLDENSELNKFHQQFVMGGIMVDNEFWCIRKIKRLVLNCHQTLKTVKREDAHLLRKYGIQFKGGPEQVVQFSENATTSRSAF